MLGQAISFRFRNTRDVTSQNLSMYIESYAAMHQLRIWNTFQHLSTCAIMFSHFYRWETTMRKHGEIHQHPQQLPTFRCQGSEMSLSRCKREICSWPALDDKNHLLTLEVKHTPELNFLSEILNKKTLNLWYYHRWKCWKNKHPNNHWAMSSQPLSDASIPNFGIVKQSNTWND